MVLLFMLMVGTFAMANAKLLGLPPGWVLLLTWAVVFAAMFLPDSFFRRSSS